MYFIVRVMILVGVSKLCDHINSIILREVHMRRFLSLEVIIQSMVGHLMLSFLRSMGCRIDRRMDREYLGVGKNIEKIRYRYDCMGVKNCNC